jgi:hypothetical protein
MEDSDCNRAIFAWLYQLRASLLNAVVIVQPDTVARGLRLMLALEVSIDRRSASDLA